MAREESVTSFIERLRAMDIRLILEAERLRVNAPKGAIGEELKAKISARRDEIIDALRVAENAVQVFPRIARDGPLPLSSAQKRLWFLDRVNPGSQYNIGFTVRFRGALDAGRLQRALDELALRHELLRCRIVERDGDPQLEILPAAKAVLEIIEHPGHAGSADEARQLCAERLRTPYDLARGPLARYLLVRSEPDDAWLAFGMHHAIGDRWSLMLAVRELCSIYSALTEGGAIALAPLRVQYVDYAAWEREQLRTDKFARQLSYWKQQLAGAPALLELPTDRPRTASQTFRGHVLQRELHARALEAIKQLARQHDATLFMTLLAACQVLLARYSGQNDIVVGSPIANRERVELESIVGCFVNNIVLRTRIDGNPSFTALLSQVKTTTLSAFDHRDLPFDVLVDALRPGRNTTHAPIFQTLFTLHSFPLDFIAPRGLRVEILDRDPGTARFDLALEAVEFDGKLTLSYEYATDLFDERTIARMHTHLARLLAAVAAEPDKGVLDAPLLAAEDEALLLGAWNDTALEHDRGRCVHHLLEASASATPDAVAVVDHAGPSSYRTLDERANRLAQLLVRRGVTQGSLVAVCVDRTADMPVAIAAVLKAGAAYVPLDPTHPGDRLQYILDDAGVACAITLLRFAPLLDGARAPLLCLDELAAELDALPPLPPTTLVGPADRAYVIYTSGSTGRPKGVEVEHRNVVAFLEAMQREPGFSARDVLLAVTTLSFDIAGLEMWLPLMTGGRVVVASRGEVLDGERMKALLEQHDVTVMQATPATWRLLLETGWEGKRDLKVLCGGEPLPHDLATALVPRVAELWNMYGPTETTIWSTLSKVEDPARGICIGRPIANTRVYVLDKSGRPSPIGVAGELCIGGEGVARGYHDRPDLTRDRFVVVALPNRVERVYKTGDMARFRGDGQLEFLGRRDHQVKIRGYRIELGEIETVLSTHPGLKQHVVAIREDVPGDQSLVGYVVPAPGTTFDAESARATLRSKLPEYMVPNQFVVLEALPLTPNGKIDRKALPAPTTATQRSDTAADATMTPAQRRVAAIWREVLRAERIGLHDNFFDIGGHSLLLVKLHAALRRDLNVDLALVELFQYTTVAAQAERLVPEASADAGLRRAQTSVARQATHG